VAIKLFSFDLITVKMEFHTDSLELTYLKESLISLLIHCFGFYCCSSPSHFQFISLASSHSLFKFTNQFYLRSWQLFQSMLPVSPFMCNNEFETIEYQIQGKTAKLQCF